MSAQGFPSIGPIWEEDGAECVLGGGGGGLYEGSGFGGAGGGG